jgi:hypothetical protein
VLVFGKADLSAMEDRKLPGEFEANILFVPWNI